MLIFSLCLYFLIITILSVIKTPKIENQTLNLFKSMFPSWKFFDESTDTPVLLFRTIQNEIYSEWNICLPPPKNQWYKLLINPNGNFYLAHHSQIQQLLSELTHFDETKIDLFHLENSYLIVENFVRFELKKRKILDGFQFKLSSIQLIDQKNFKIIEDILISPMLLPQEEMQ